MTHSDSNVAVTFEREAHAVRGSTHEATRARQTSEAVWARAVRLLLMVVAATVAVVGLIDSALAWETRLVLSGAARAAAKVTVSTPLNTKNCGGTPCSIESAAGAAKSYLIGAGYSQASCIDPEKPSFSGVLVWAFSCDPSVAADRAANFCDTSDGAVCVKVDMTAAEIQRDGTIVPYTRATVQYPHSSMMASILSLLPERLEPRLAKSVAGSAMLRLPY
jgi:hypothetical protein